MSRDPFSAAYYSAALARAERLRQAPPIDIIGAYTVLSRAEGIAIARDREGQLVALKAASDQLSVDEAVRLIQFTGQGFLPLLDVHIDVMWSPRLTLCTPYCEGGSLRDRFTGGGPDADELAYHLLCLASALERLHARGLVHGDVKPDNVLLGFDTRNVIEDARWRTWLADLESVAEVGGVGHWRITERYAAPEQIAGAPAAAAMDVWAWGITLLEAAELAAAPAWLIELGVRATAADPTVRPTAAGLVAAFGRHLAFGPTRDVYVGSLPDRSSPLFAMGSAPDLFVAWPSHGNVVHGTLSFDSVWELEECRQLFRLGSAVALRRIAEIADDRLGDPADPSALWHHLDDDGSPETEQDHNHVFEVVAPQEFGPHFVTELLRALVGLVEKTGDPNDLERLVVAARAAERLPDRHEWDVLLAQAWLLLDRIDLAEIRLARALSVDRHSTPVRGTLWLFHVAAGVQELALAHALDAAGAAPTGDEAVGWLGRATTDLLECGDYELLDSYGPDLHHIDVIAVAQVVVAGRRGDLRRVAESWPRLRATFGTLSSSTSVEKMRYVLEAAMYMSDVEFAVRRADIVRQFPAARMPLYHRHRAAVEAMALGRLPDDRSITQRLADRSELWDRDGRPHDPLRGLDLSVADRWRTGRLLIPQPPPPVSPALQALIDHSQASIGPDDEEYVQSHRTCWRCTTTDRLARQAVCGDCHRVSCRECATACPCGGAVTVPGVPPREPIPAPPKPRRISHHFLPRWWRHPGPYGRALARLCELCKTRAGYIALIRELGSAEGYEFIVGAAHETRFHRTGHRRYLDAAIEAYTSSGDLTDSEAWTWSQLTQALAFFRAVGRRYFSTGESRDFHAAIRVGMLIGSATGPGHDEYDWALYRMCRLHRYRYHLYGDESDAMMMHELQACRVP